jgi:hypothetical protein
LATSRPLAPAAGAGPDADLRQEALYVIGSLDGAPASVSVAALRDWLARTFADATVLEPQGTGRHALEWMRHDCQSRSRLDGWLSREGTFYLFGEPELARETAQVMREWLQPDAPS